MKDERTYEEVREPFTDKQMAEMRESLVVVVGELANLESEKKQADSALGAAIKTARKGMYDLQRKLEAGYEVIRVEVVYIMDEPEPGVKKIQRFDNNETIRVEPMTLRERQQSFGFEERGGEPTK